MIQRVLALLMLLCFAQVANAQTWSGPGQQPISYPTSGNTWTGVIGDGTTAQGGIPPAYGHEPADIGATDYTYNQWVPTTGISRTLGGGQDKARFNCNSSHVAQEDPILFPGQTMVGHWHEFVGNTLAGKNSTYSSLRTSGKSTCPGGPVNRTAYWKPALMKDLQSGVSVIIRSDGEIFYYQQSTVDSPKKTRIPNGFAFIGGVNPADPTNTAVTGSLPAGWSLDGFNGANGTGFQGWVCMLANGTQLTSANGGVQYPAFQTPEGNDPWAGACVAGSTIYADIAAPGCWDGKNLTSVGGRNHVRYHIRGPDGQLHCPTGWWEVPMFFAKSEYTVGVGGWEDYRYWYLSSDRFGLTEANWRRPGSTFHFDWMGAWDPTAFKKWQNECTGVAMPGLPGNGADCNSATIGTNARLLSNGEASPDTTKSNNPVVDLSIRHWDDGVGRFYGVKQGMQASVNMGHLHHGVPPVGTVTAIANQRYVYAEGDSISLYTSNFYPFIYDQARQRVTVCGRTDNGGSGMLTGPRGGVSGRVAEIAASSCGTAVGGPDVVTLLIGANDMPHGDQTAWFVTLWAYTDALRAQGKKVVLGTILPKGPPISDYISFNAGRANANVTIRAAVGVHIDAVADFAANSTIGDDADGANTTLYPDGLHPSATAHATMATIYGTALDNVLLISKK